METLLNKIKETGIAIIVFVKHNLRIHRNSCAELRLSESTLSEGIFQDVRLSVVKWRSADMLGKPVWLTEIM